MAQHSIKPRAVTGTQGESPLELELEDTVRDVCTCHIVHTWSAELLPSTWTACKEG